MQQVWQLATALFLIILFVKLKNVKLLTLDTKTRLIKNFLSNK